ncbi:Hypothetical predicted protein [Podarcis lilfordi]|uniref:Uncharacterized protein n=1 Tax=Podarcis lilfordi TaxID=74358 RepID=A0AA35NX60_9SAUR|nr:Hypothetical predicted protein [Podarcis lilfordi]
MGCNASPGDERLAVGRRKLARNCTPPSLLASKAVLLAAPTGSASLASLVICVRVSPPALGKESRLLLLRGSCIGALSICRLLLDE